MVLKLSGLGGGGERRNISGVYIFFWGGGDKMENRIFNIFGKIYDEREKKRRGNKENKGEKKGGKGEGRGGGKRAKKSIREL